MRFKALHQFTAKLPEVSADGETILLGYDTETCIRSGVILGIAAEVDGIINQYQTQYPELNVVLTGGDSTLFANRLKSKIFADAHFQFKGLYQILRHNVG
jgi:type III pantothenate kinase